jgi:maltose O-acetyltransferase
MNKNKTIGCGRRSYVGDYSTWQAADKFSITIGKHCKISHNVRAYTETSVADTDFSNPQIPVKRGNIIIEDYVWIGANVFITPGVTIGSNSIVGANSGVVKDTPPFSIYGGVPAKLIRYKNISKQ